MRRPNSGHRVRRVLQPIVSVALAGGVLGLASCTALGGWLYDDPTFVLSELTVRGSGNPSDTLELVLTACNRNDYPVQATAIQVSLDMEGGRIGSTQYSQAFTLGTRDSTKFTVPIPLPPESREPGASFSYVVTGVTTLMTPIGERKVEIFQQGDVRLKPRDEVAHIDRAGRPCRPGKSTLPGYMPTPVMLPAPPPAPIPVSQPGP